MFKWDRLIRHNKLPKKLNYVEDELDKSVDYVNSEDERSDENLAVGNDEYELVELEILPTKIICPDCGGITLEGLEFCDKCGGEIL